MISTWRNDNIVEINYELLTKDSSVGFNGNSDERGVNYGYIGLDNENINEKPDLLLLQGTVTKFILTS